MKQRASAWACLVLASAIGLLLGSASRAGETSPSRAVRRGERVLARADHAWMSQQIEEPCILPNPKVPGRLIMFYSAVAASKIGRAHV